MGPIIVVQRTGAPAGRQGRSLPEKTLWRRRITRLGARSVAMPGVDRRLAEPERRNGSATRRVTLNPSPRPGFRAVCSWTPQAYRGERNRASGDSLACEMRPDFPRSAILRRCGSQRNPTAARRKTMS